MHRAMDKNKRLTLKYALIQGLYWMSFCTVINFAVVFLSSKGYSNESIGVIVALANVASIFTQPILASFADKRKCISIKKICQLLMLLSMLLAILLFIIPNSFFITALLFIGIAAILLTLQPLINSLALAYINKGISINFGLARGIGSVSYGAVSYIMGSLMDIFTSEVIIPTYIIFSIFFILAFIFFEGSSSKQDKITSEEETNTASSSDNYSYKMTLWQFFSKYKSFSISLLGMVMIFTSHSLLNTYMIKVVENIGGGTADLGKAIALAAIIELPAMFSFSFMIKKIKINTLLLISTIAFIGKSLVTLMASSMSTIYTAQLLQFLAYAIFLPASVYYANEAMEERDRIKGQAYLGAIMSASGVIGSVLGGWILDRYDVSSMLLLALILPILGSAILYISLKEKNNFLY